MRCPFCGKDDTQVKDSRASEDGATNRTVSYTHLTLPTTVQV